ncbi:hypothetical protein HZC09_02250 [Candidatus Micrarchaeota archaeon]|nr:hypothetical protein [Candidatus Micrarchaeota archaeon]
MLGGGAMVFRDQKPATKDLDLVFLDEKSCECFASFLKGLGFVREKSGLLEPEYAEMGADGIWKTASDFRLDLFVRWVCKALELTPSMVERSALLGVYGNLSVRLVSNEDVVLFKSVTDRDRDLADIAAVVRSSGVDWDLILNECKVQSSKRPWHGWVYDKLVVLKETRGIDAPILPELEKLSEKDVVRAGFQRRLEQGMSRKEALADLRRMGFSEKEIEWL